MSDGLPKIWRIPYNLLDRRSIMKKTFAIEMDNLLVGTFKYLINVFRMIPILGLNKLFPGCSGLRNAGLLIWILQI